MLDAGTASVEMELNGANWLSARCRVEATFRLHGCSTEMLVWPDALRMWASSLSACEQRHARNVRKHERVCALFDSALVATSSTEQFSVGIHSQLLSLLLE